MDAFHPPWLSDFCCCVVISVRCHQVSRVAKYLKVGNWIHQYCKLASSKQCHNKCMYVSFITSVFTSFYRVVSGNLAKPFIDSETFEP